MEHFHFSDSAMLSTAFEMNFVWMDDANVWQMFVFQLFFNFFFFLFNISFPLTKVILFLDIFFNEGIYLRTNISLEQ